MLRGFLSWCCPAGWRGSLERAQEISPLFSISETAKARMQYMEMSGRSTALAKARWRSRIIWGFDPTRETAARGEALFILCFLGLEMEARERMKKLSRRDKNCF